MTTFDITATIEWSAYEIPPRCRKARLVRHTTTATVGVPTATAEEAPVAFEVVSDLPDVAPRVVLTHGGALYEPYLPWSGQKDLTLAGDKRFPAEQPFRLGTVRDEAEAIRLVEEQANRFLVVDGVVYPRAGEPRYAVMTFGMGHNHGGTDLVVADSDNPNLAADSYFRADDFEAARAHAIEVADRRGDTESVEALRKMTPPIRVHIPEAVTLVVVPQESEQARHARARLRTAAHAYLDVLASADGGEAEAYSALVEARAALTCLTDDVSGSSRERRPYEARR